MAVIKFTKDEHWLDFNIARRIIYALLAAAFVYIAIGYTTPISSSTAQPITATSPQTAALEVNKVAQPLVRAPTNTSATNTKAQAIFSDIYSRFVWGQAGRGSGGGSTIGATTRIRSYLEQKISELGVRVMLDAPCGAMEWMPTLLEKVESNVHMANPEDDFYYLGLDIVPSVIEASKTRFTNKTNWQFAVFDISKDSFPDGDLLLTRDALQHLSYEVIINALENIASSNIKYLAVGSHLNSANKKIEVGDYFAIDVRKEPFALDFQMDVFDEQVDNKVMLLYKGEDLKQVDYAAMRQRAGVLT